MRQNSEGNPRGLFRGVEGRLLAGVCVGLAQRFDLDLVLVRLALLLLVLARGLGLFLYLAGWLLIPSSDSDLSSRSDYRFIIRQNLSKMSTTLLQFLQGLLEKKQRPSESLGEGWPSLLTRRSLAFSLIGGGTFLVLYSWGFFSWLGATRAVGLTGVAIGAAVLLTQRSE
jgi:phage shock protein PspC (stress-responsive transcriptional regulator)